MPATPSAADPLAIIRAAEKVAPVKAGDWFDAPDHGNQYWRRVQVIARRPSRFRGRDSVTFANGAGVRTSGMILRHGEGTR